MESFDSRIWWTRLGISRRLTSDAFLEAAVNGAFLIAAADGAASPEEYDLLLDRLELLGGIDRDKIDDFLTTASNELESTGFEPRIARVAELVGDSEDARAVFLISLAVALADRDVSDEEREIATQLAAGIGLADTNLDDVFAELRG